MTLPIRAKGYDDPALNDVEAHGDDSFRPKVVPGRRTFDACVNEFHQYRHSRVGLTVKAMVEWLLEDRREELCGEDGDDLSIWEQGRLVAAILFRAGAPPQVVLFDEEGGAG